ncbi:helix-turn-helix domain-containing protein [Leucobacter triazinivorans]|jgi:transcriptional regulator with XRE-family HTH domain|uniref:helix-turn-helix domain-containing protein n=1 Tax=Leucobacter triazinivorans TaxID=1784719 RepID=UPI0013EEBEFF|nr:helix-turn-helix transcriptional regulator [Leucobacter triazinivorans]|tara:strand:+ start:3196 stop:3849 length:654 start_codon:yes stop_codon:yes gene_type:complete
MENERVRGNPAGITNTHVAQNIRAARQAIGMDLRTMSDGLHAAGRKMSPSGISKLEAGDRRVDVDDLTVIAYLLRTTPAALLTPPDEQTTLTGVPDGYEPEEIDRWMRGELVLTDEGLFNYWQKEWVICTDRIHHLETTLDGMTTPSKDDPEKTSAHPKTIAAYQERLETARARARVIQERGVQLDPDGRVFNAKDYIDNYADTHRPGQITARSTRS